MNKLTIPCCEYKVGRQQTGGATAYTGADVLAFKEVHDLTIEGEPGAVIRYRDGLRFGAFDPKTGLPFEHGDNYFAVPEYIGRIGYCISLEGCDNIEVKGVELDGNSENLILGGVYGDTGIQIPHTGIFVINSKNVKIDSVNVHHFGLDGLTIDLSDSVEVTNSSFEYCSRDAMSIVGGSHIRIKNCKANHSGKPHFASNPIAGIDIEAERGPIRDVLIEDCEFINNGGCGVVADNGDSRDVTFSRCLIWGVTNWAVWITRPGYNFIDCLIYGSICWGYKASTDEEATKYIRCHFEDKEYEGAQPYGLYLVNSNGAKRMLFEDCTFVANKCKLLWLGGNGFNPDEYYVLRRCKLIVKKGNVQEDKLIAAMVGVRFEDVEIIYEEDMDYYISESNNEGTYKIINANV